MFLWSWEKKTVMTILIYNFIEYYKLRETRVSKPKTNIITIIIIYAWDVVIGNFLFPLTFLLITACVTGPGAVYSKEKQKTIKGILK